MCKQISSQTGLNPKTIESEYRKRYQAKKKPIRKFEIYYWVLRDHWLFMFLKCQSVMCNILRLISSNLWVAWFLEGIFNYLISGLMVGLKEMPILWKNPKSTLLNIPQKIHHSNLVVKLFIACWMNIDHSYTFIHDIIINADGN